MKKLELNNILLIGVLLFSILLFTNNTKATSCAQNDYIYKRDSNNRIVVKMKYTFTGIGLSMGSCGEYYLEEVTTYSYHAKTNITKETKRRVFNRLRNSIGYSYRLKNSKGITIKKIVYSKFYNTHLKIDSNATHYQSKITTYFRSNGTKQYREYYNRKLSKPVSKIKYFYNKKGQLKNYALKKAYYYYSNNGQLAKKKFYRYDSKGKIILLKIKKYKNDNKTIWLGDDIIYR